MYSHCWKKCRIGILVTAMLLLSGLAGAATEKYLGPCDVVGAHDGKSLFVVNADAKTIAVVAIPGGKTTQAFPLSERPSGATLSADGKILYVTCGAAEGKVLALDSQSGKVTATIAVGHTPMSPVISSDGKTLYACNRFNNDISVIDLTKEKESARITCLREPVAAALRPDGKRLFVANHLPAEPANEYDIAVSITVIDTKTHKTSHVRLPNGSNTMRGICVSPNGKYAFATHQISRYIAPHGAARRWISTSAVTLIDAKSKKPINSVLLDDVDLGAATPWGVQCSADSKQLCVVHAGTHEVSIIDIPGVLNRLSQLPPDEQTLAKNKDKYQKNIGLRTAKDVPNSLAFLVDLRRRVLLEPRSRQKDPSKCIIKGPRNLAIVGNTAYVAVYFSDLLSVVPLDTKTDSRIESIALGTRPQWTDQRRGEILFNDATLTFQNYYSCATCHPEGRADGINWEWVHGREDYSVGTLSTLLAHRTSPLMISGSEADFDKAIQRAVMHNMFAIRPEPEVRTLGTWVKSLEPVPSPLLVKGKLSEKARRGKVVFEKTGCGTCHLAPLFTDKKTHDVGTRAKHDRRDTFDTPTLIETWRTAPYLHDGRYTTLKEIFSKGRHGDSDKLTDEEIEALVEYVGSL